MKSVREAFFERVRAAVKEGNSAGLTPPLPQRGTVGYQGGGPDPVQRFATELKAAGGNPHIVPSAELAVALVQELVDARKPRRLLLGHGTFLDKLNLSRRLAGSGRELITVAALEARTSRDELFAADLSVSGVAYLIAETGSVVVTTRPDEPRGLTLLPPIHIALAERSQLLPDLFDLIAAFQPGAEPDEDYPIDLPSCLALITGPSKTGDIELKLVTGVHGPGELHVIVVDSRV